MHTQDSEQEQWWARTLQRLREDLDALVADFLARLHEIDGSYHAVTEGDLDRTARDSLSLLIDKLANRPMNEEAAQLPRRLGVRRAQQGVPRDHLLEAVRLDYRVLWNGLVRVVDPQDAQRLVGHAEDVLTAVEWYIREVQTAFLNELEMLTQDSRSRQGRALARLLAAYEQGAAPAPGSVSPVEEVARQVAHQLGLPLDGRFEVTFISSEAAGTAMQLAERLPADQRYLTWDAGDGVLFVREAHGYYGPASLRAGHGEGSAVRGGTGMDGEPVHPLATVRGVLLQGVRGLVHVPPAAKLARRYAPHARGGLCLAAQLWVPAAAAALRPAFPSVGVDAFHDLNALPDAERERLVDTFLSYCAHGSVKTVAERMYVHRNTVDNRLRAFRHVTGLDPAVPVEAARAMLELGLPVPDAR